MDDILTKNKKWIVTIFDIVFPSSNFSKVYVRRIQTIPIEDWTPLPL